MQKKCVIFLCMDHVGTYLLSSSFLLWIEGSRRQGQIFPWISSLRYFIRKLHVGILESRSWPRKFSLLEQGRSRKGGVLPGREHQLESFPSVKTPRV